MNFAILGYDQAIHDLLRQLISASEHSLVALVQVDAETPDPSPPLPSSMAQLPWQSLLAGGDEIDAIIVGDAQRHSHQEPLRKLTQAGVPMIVHYASCDVILAFELEMIRRDVRGILLPYFAGIHDRRFANLTRWSPRDDETWSDTPARQEPESDAPWGPIQQVTMQRHAEFTNRRWVEQQFAQDAYWLRKLVGAFDRLGALGPRTDNDLANLSVHMSAGQVVVKWSLLPASDPSPTSLAVVGEHNTTQLTWDAESQTWSVPFGSEDASPTRTESGPESGADSDLAALVKLLDHPTAAALEWEHACRALELVETVGRSLRRGKTVELYNEDVTEEDTFKSLMAAGGCGAILLALMAIVVMAVIETLEIPLLEADFFHHWPGKLLYWRNWPIYLAGALGVFLSLQLLKLAFPTRKSPD